MIALPAFSDNDIWMLHDAGRTCVVDPGEAAPVDRALERHGLELAGILVTRHPGDHVGGIDALRPRPMGSVCVALDEGDAVEYMLSNLKSGRAVEPRNEAIADPIATCERLRPDGEPTFPSRIALERIDPYLRCEEAAVVDSARAHCVASASAVDVFAALRRCQHNHC